MSTIHKFDIGDNVWFIDYRYVYGKCDICEDGTVEIKGFSFRCPKCKGDKQGIYKTTEWLVANANINFIRIEKSILENEISVDVDYMFYVGEDYYTREEDELFSTEEEALVACEVKNKEKQNVLSFGIK